MNTNPAVYNDMTGLANLKARAAEQSPEATREAARQFEALFVQMMLKSMRSASEIFGEDRDRTYEEMFDQQISIEMTRGQGIGIAELLSRQLGAKTGTTPAPGQYTMPQASPLPRADKAVAAAPQRSDWRPADAGEFIRDLLPHAERAARALDVDPRSLLAQAALETGWGQHLIRDGRGVSGNNLFGIKADNRWNGERLAVTTLEYEGGLAQRVRDNFRAYPSLKDSFEDYVDFLKSNPRYADATRGGLSPGEYAASLQEAGYATDPRYAEKISDIAAGERLNDLVGTLKKSGEMPITL